MSIDLSSHQSAVATDSFGVTHLVWVDQGAIWHAVYDDNSGTWCNAVVVSSLGTANVKGLNLVTSPTLIGGQSPGLAIVFQQGNANSSDFYYTAAQYSENGDLQWLDMPQVLTSDQVADLKPSAIVYNSAENGTEVIVTGTKLDVGSAENMAVNEDADVYVQQLMVASSLFSNAQDAETTPESAPYHPMLTAPVVLPARQSTSAETSSVTASPSLMSASESSGSSSSGESDSHYDGLGGSWGIQLAFTSDLMKDWNLLDTTPKSALLHKIISAFLSDWSLDGVLSGGETIGQSWANGLAIPGHSLFLNTSAKLGHEKEDWWKGNAGGFSLQISTGSYFSGESPNNLLALTDNLSLTFSLSRPIISPAETGFFKLTAEGAIGVNFGLLAQPDASGQTYSPQSFYPALELGAAGVAENAALALAFSGLAGGGASTVGTAILGMTLAETLAAFISHSTSGLELSGLIQAPVIEGNLTGLVSPFALLSPYFAMENGEGENTSGKKVPPLSLEMSGGVSVSLDWGIKNTSLFDLGFPVSMTAEIWGPLKIGISIEPAWSWDMFSSDESESESGSEASDGSSEAQPTNASVEGSLLKVVLASGLSQLPAAEDFMITVKGQDGKLASIKVFDVLQDPDVANGLILRLEQAIPSSRLYRYGSSLTQAEISSQEISLSFTNNDGVKDASGSPVANTTVTVTNKSPDSYSTSYHPTSGNSQNYVNPSVKLSFNTELQSEGINSATLAGSFSIKVVKSNVSLVPADISIVGNRLVLELPELPDSVNYSDLDDIIVSYTPPQSGGLTDTVGNEIGAFTVNNALTARISQSTLFISDQNGSIQLGSNAADYTVTLTDDNGQPVSGASPGVSAVTSVPNGVMLMLSAAVDPSQNAVIQYNGGSASCTINTLLSVVTPPTIATKSALANISADLGQDSPPSLSLMSNGQVLGAWITEVPPIVPIAGFMYSPDNRGDDYTLVLDFIDSLGNATLNPPAYPDSSQFIVTETTTGTVFSLDTNEGMGGITIDGSVLTLYLNPDAMSGFQFPENPLFTVQYSINASGGQNNLFFTDATTTTVWVDDFSTNIVDQTSVSPDTAPSLQGAGCIVASSTSNQLNLIFDQVLDINNQPPGNASFIVESNGIVYSVTDVSVEGNAVGLTVKTPTGLSPIGIGDLVTVSYTGSSLRNSAGTKVAAFAGQPVTTAASSPTTVLKYGSGPGADAVLGEPGTIPGSDGINFYPALALDQKGNNVLVWAHADLSTIKTSLLPGEYYSESEAALINDALSATDIQYAIYDKSTDQWSPAATLGTALAGADGKISLGIGPGGNLMAAWTNQQVDATSGQLLSQLMWSQLTYDAQDIPSWSTPEVLDSGAKPDPLSELVVGSVDGQPAVFWTRSQPYSYSALTEQAAPLLYFRLAETGGTAMLNDGSLGAGATGVFTGVGGSNPAVQFRQTGALENPGNPGGDPNPAALFNPGSSASLPGNLGFSQDSFSMEFWFKVPELPVSGESVALVSAPGLGSLTLQGATLNYTIDGQVLTPNASTPGLRAGQWYYVVASYDGAANSANLYLNGSSVASLDNLDFTPASTTNLILAGADNTHSVYLDEVAFYDSALTDHSISSGKVDGYDVLQSLMNHGDGIAEKYQSKYITPLAPGPDTQYVVYDTGSNGWGSETSIHPTQKPVATALADFNQPAWDVVSAVQAAGNATVAPNGVTDLYLPLTLSNQQTSQKLTNITVTAGSSTWSLFPAEGANQLGLLENGHLLNPLSTLQNLNYFIKNPTVNLGLLLDPGSSGVSSQTSFTVTVQFGDQPSQTMTVNPVTPASTIGSTSVTGTATVTEANDFSLSLIDSGFPVNTTNTAMGYELASNDFNGDGLSDVAVANRGYTNSSGVVLDKGSVQILFGGQDVLNDNETTALSTLNLEGNPNGLLITGIPDRGQANGNVSMSLATGYINGDSCADLIIGSANYSNYQGAVYVIYGGTGLANTTIDVSAWQPNTPYSNGYLLTQDSAGDFGFSVAVGNFDGNAQSDIVIGAPGSNSGDGSVYLAMNGQNPTQIYTSQGSAELAGYAVAVSSSGSSTKANSFTGSASLDDLLIGAPAHQVNVSNQWDSLGSLPKNVNDQNAYPSVSSAKVGAVYILSPSSTASSPSTNPFSSSPNLTYLGSNLPAADTSTAANTFAGSAIASADWDGDGTNDLAISAPWESGGNGSVYVIKGGSNSTSNSVYLNTIANLVIEGGLPGSSTGTVIANAGDVNDDGYQDFLITAPQGVNGTGQSYVVFGPLSLGDLNAKLDLNVTATDTKTTLLLNGALPNQMAGTAAAAIGDINHDDVDDLMVTAPNAAQLYAMYGHPWLADDGSLKLADMSGDNGFITDGQLYSVNTQGGTITLSSNGSDVAMLGDVNGDGFADVLSGGDPNGQLVIFGNSTMDLVDAASGSNDLMILTDAGAFQSAMALGDFDGDGYEDLGIVANEQFALILGGQDLTAGGQLTVQPDITVNAKPVTLATGVGDLDGDGYDDILLQNTEGAVNLYWGNAGAALQSPQSINPGSNTVFAGIGDVNGDGYDDMVASNPEGQGQFTLYYGNASRSLSSSAFPSPVTISAPSVTSSSPLNNSDWSFYSSQASNQNTTLSGQGTDLAPSFAVFNNYLYMLYNSDDSNELLIQRSADGYHWEGLTNLGSGFETYEQASLAVFDNTLYLAFTGTNKEVLLAAAQPDDSDLGVSFSTSSNFFQIDGQTAYSGPTLVAYDNNLYVFFEATYNKNAPICYNWSSNPSNASSWGNFDKVDNGSQYTDSQIGATVIPGSANNGAGTLVISYKSNDNNDIWVGNFTGGNGGNWECSTISGQTTPTGPSLTTVNDTAYLFFQGNGNNTVNYMSSTNGSNWASFNNIPNQTTNDRPSPVFFEESLYVGFEGTSKYSINMEISNPIYEPNQSQQFGAQFQNIGDFNGDGIADLAVLAPSYLANIGYLDSDVLTNNQGALLIYYGSNSGFTSTATPDLVLVPPVAQSGDPGYSISNFSAAGDLDGDGYDDLVLASPDTSLSGDGTSDGIMAVVFGGDASSWGQYSGVSQPFSLGLLPHSTLAISGSNQADQNLGFIIEGLPASTAGKSLGGGADVNGDGFSDFIVGAPGNHDALTYTIFGSDFNQTVNQTGTIGDDVMVGSPTGESFIAGQGDDRIYGNGGIDIVYAGPGDDLVSVNSTYFRRMDGGTGSDTLLLNGYNGQNWDITSLSPGLRLKSFEILSTEDYGKNTLTLNSASVTALSSNNILTLLMDETDELELSQDFRESGFVYQYNQNFTQYVSSASAAVILVNQKFPASQVSYTAPSSNSPVAITDMNAGVSAASLMSVSPVEETTANPALLQTQAAPASLSISSPRVSEAAGEVSFTVSRHGDTGQSMLISYLSEDGSAKAGQNYLPTAGRLVFAPGETEKTIKVKLINDGVYTGDQNLKLTLRKLGEFQDTLDRSKMLEATLDAHGEQIRGWQFSQEDTLNGTMGGTLKFSVFDHDDGRTLDISLPGLESYNTYFSYDQQSQQYRDLFSTVPSAVSFEYPSEGGTSGPTGIGLKLSDGKPGDTDQKINGLVNVNGYVGRVTPGLLSENGQIFNVPTAADGQLQWRLIQAPSGNYATGVIQVDNAQGQINGVNPNDPAYLALAEQRLQPLFSNQTGAARSALNESYAHSSLINARILNQSDGRDFGATAQSDFSGGQYFILYQKVGNELTLSTMQAPEVLSSGRGYQHIDFAGVSLEATTSAIVVPGMQGKDMPVYLTASRSSDSVDDFALFQVDSLTGGLDINHDGKIDLQPGDVGYAKAALERALDTATGKGIMIPDNLRISHQNQILDATGMYGVVFSPGYSLKQVLEQNDLNVPGSKAKAFFSFDAANPDGLSHMARLADNLFAFEDGDDRDFNDLVLQLSFQTSESPKTLSVYLPQSQSYTFRPADIPFIDSTEATGPQSLKITGLPLEGKLTLDGEPVMKGSIINASDIDHLVYRGPLGVNGNWTQTLAFQLGNGDQYSSPYTFMMHLSEPQGSIRGTPKTDMLKGTSRADVLLADAGNDIVNGYGRNDRIYGQEGRDILNGGSGNDLLSGGQGNDSLSGNNGADTLVGGEGDDVLSGGLGKDTYLYLANTLGIDDLAARARDTINASRGDSILFNKAVWTQFTRDGKSLDDFKNGALGHQIDLNNNIAFDGRKLMLDVDADGKYVPENDVTIVVTGHIQSVSIDGYMGALILG